jgi:4-carboxymuconolactone decarboxylase
MNETFDRGLAIRKEVLGPEYVQRSLDRADDFNRDFQEFVTEYCWGACWGRDALPRTTRSLVTLAILAGLGRWEEFELHLRGAMRNGCTSDEIKDMMFHVAVYAGVPAGVSAFRSAARVVAESASSNGEVP